MVERADVERAAEVIRGRLHRTPLLSCRTLGDDVFLKAELLQRTGSFKPRGVLTKLASLTGEEKARGVIAASAGNHAAALAFGAALEGIDVLQRETGRVLVHPFDDPLVVAGQGTVGLEILEDVPDVRRIVV